jgi:DNA polymerase
MHLDFETRSRIDLLAHGAYLYAADPSTEIICMAYAMGLDDPVKLWTPGRPVPDEVLTELAKDEPRHLYAHNAQFERLIVRHVLPRYDAEVRQPPLDAWYCTAAQARRRNYPGSLEGLGIALDAHIQKSMAGKQLIKRLCMPYGEDGRIDWEAGKFNKDPDLLQKMYDYCERDVEAERLLAELTPALTDDEFDDYVVSEIINDAGLLVDVQFAIQAMEYANDETAAISEELDRITSGYITTPRQFSRIKEYFEPWREKDAQFRHMCTRHKTSRQTGKTTVTVSMDKSVRATILDSPEDFDPHVVELIELLDEAGRSSTSKYRQMVSRASADNRVRGAYIYSGATQTGRFSSVGLQVHNFTRDCADIPEEMRELVMEGYQLDDVMNDLASMLRPSIMAAPGHTFVCGDWSQIEARVLPWLSDEPAAQSVLDTFAHCDSHPDDPDIYELQAALMNVPDRQIGKVAVLSLGYEGGRKAFAAMARNYGLVVSEEDAERYKNAWRNTNPWAPAFWAACNAAATSAIKLGGEWPAGKVVYAYDEAWDMLTATLPTGGVLYYPKPRIELVKTPWDEMRPAITAIKASWKPAAGQDEWPRVALYGGTRRVRPPTS